MSGMLPGVEAARRRKTHHRAVKKNSEGCNSRKSSAFCLYAANSFHKFDTTPIPKSVQKELKVSDGINGDELEAVAREAKERLDLRLQSRWKSQIQRSTKGPTTKSCNGDICILKF